MYWELDFGAGVQSNCLHRVVLLPWFFLWYTIGKYKLHSLPPLPVIKVNHVLEMAKQEGIKLTTWICPQNVKFISLGEQDTMVQDEDHLQLNYVC